MLPVSVFFDAACRRTQSGVTISRFLVYIYGWVRGHLTFFPLGPPQKRQKMGEYAIYPNHLSNTWKHGWSLNVRIGKRQSWRKGGTGEQPSPLQIFMPASRVTAAHFYCSLHGYTDAIRSSTFNAASCHSTINPKWIEFRLNSSLVGLYFVQTKTVTQCNSANAVQRATRRANICSITVEWTSFWVETSVRARTGVHIVVIKNYQQAQETLRYGSTGLSGRENPTSKRQMQVTR